MGSGGLIAKDHHRSSGPRRSVLKGREGVGEEGELQETGCISLVTDNAFSLQTPGHQ